MLVNLVGRVHHVADRVTRADVEIAGDAAANQIQIEQHRLMFLGQGSGHIARDGRRAAPADRGHDMDHTRLFPHAIALGGAVDRLGELGDLLERFRCAGIQIDDHQLRRIGPRQQRGERLDAWKLGDALHPESRQNSHQFLAIVGVGIDNGTTERNVHLSTSGYFIGHRLHAS